MFVMCASNGDSKDTVKKETVSQPPAKKKEKPVIKGENYNTHACVCWHN